MKLWWLTDSGRLATERRAVEALARDEGWFALDQWCLHEANLAVLGVICAHGQRYPVRLIYPDQFPEVPAWIEPQDATRWSAHQYGAGGALCLELRPDNWVMTATGADLLRSAHRLLMIEDPFGGTGKRAPSAHQIGEVQSYAWDAQPVLVGTGCCDRLRSGNASGLKALRWKATDDVWPIMIHDEQDRASLRRPPEADLHSWRFEIPVFVSASVPPSRVPDRASLVGAGHFGVPVATQVLAQAASLVLFTGGAGELAAFHVLADGEPRRRRVFVLPDESGMRSGRAAEAPGKRVAIVGVGSVGSKIAESLVRSGASRLCLVDGDVLLPANLERHALDWCDVGFRKVYGLRRHLLNIMPGADVKVVDSNLNWQRSARTHAWQVDSVAGCDLIVDATGDPAIALFLGAVADANNRAFVSVEVFEGGIGALVATCLPQRDPAFAVARAAFLAWCADQGIKPPEAGARAYEALTENGTPVVADDAAATMTAGHAARVVLDILDGKPAPISSAWLLLGFARAWLFDGHGHTIRLSVGERREAAAAKEDPDALSFALALARSRLV